MGKTHLLIALGTAAAPAGFRVRCALATKLVDELVEAADERQLAKSIARYGRVDLLCIDELDYMELDRRGAELLFQVLSEREETASVAIAIDESFTGWTKTFTCPRLCAAIVDRLTFAGSIIETGTGSYRLAHALATRNGTEPSPDTERRRQMSPTRPPHGQPVTLAAAPRAALTHRTAPALRTVLHHRRPDRDRRSPYVPRRRRRSHRHRAGLVHRQSRLRHLPSRAG